MKSIAIPHPLEVQSTVHPKRLLLVGPKPPVVMTARLDGPTAEVDDQVASVTAICRAAGAFELRLAQSDEGRALLWKGRKAAFAAMGRVASNYIVQDGVIPRTALPAIMLDILGEGGLVPYMRRHGGYANV